MTSSQMMKLVAWTPGALLGTRIIPRHCHRDTTVHHSAVVSLASNVTSGNRAQTPIIQSEATELSLRDLDLNYGEEINLFFQTTVLNSHKYRTQ